MFTGLVESLAVVEYVIQEGAGTRFRLRFPESIGGEIGDSICINGCCLTVVKIDAQLFDFQAGPETLRRTNLGKVITGDRVNIERSLPANGRLGGHFVQGHVDTTATVDQIIPDGEWISMSFRLDPEYARQMVSKGSVTVDGVSLTVVDAEPDRFSVALIPHTLQVTTLGARRPGDRVNIETDILAKYVLRMLTTGRDSLGPLSRLEERA